MTETQTLTLTDFLLARIAEDEADAQESLERGFGGWEWLADAGINFEARTHIVRWHPARVLVECEAKRRIVEWHESWPVLAEGPSTFEPAAGEDVNTMTMRMSRQIAWLTEQEYRARFGEEPPTAPILRILASVYADHPDYRDEWRP